MWMWSLMDSGIVFPTAVKENSILGLWRGTLVNLAKVSLNGGFMFFFNEICKNYSLYRNGYNQSLQNQVSKEGIDQT